MKKASTMGLIFLLTFFIGQDVRADEGAIKIGVNFSSMTNAGESTIFGDPLESKFLTGLSIGLLYRFTLLEWLSIQPELLYVENGYQQRTTGTVGSVTQRIKLNYMELPLVLRVQLNRNLYIAGGPYWARRISAKLQSHEPPLSAVTTDLDQAKKNDRGWVGAVGLILDDDSGLFLEIRYKMGSVGVFDWPDEVVHKNTSLSVSMGYGF